MTTATIPQAVGDCGPIHVDWSHLPERQPEYWWARLNERELSELDDNQRLYAERMIRKLTLLDPDADLEDITNQAICEAIARVPTTQAAVNAIAQMRSGEAYCYLAFCGLDEVARFMKVGMTGHPEQRLYNIATGNPLDCLWVFTTKIPSRAVARQAELAMLRSYADHKRRGEWIDVGQCEREGAESVARELAVVVGEITGQEATFSLLSYRDGRAAA